MSIFRSIDSSASGLTAERLRMDIISNNIANVNTTRTETGDPYRRQTPVFQERRNGNSSFSSIISNKLNNKDNIGEGVKVISIEEDDTPFKLTYDPQHPDSDEEGYVRKPNVDIISEMIDMISASRGYEANVTAMNTTKNILMKTLEIGR